MIRRIRQFFRAVCARVSEQDKRFVEQHLSAPLQSLFWGMSVPDQCHALRTAHTALRLTESEAETVDLPLLARCALLHDVGRRDGEFGIFWKCFAVLLAAWFPSRTRAYGDGVFGEGLLQRKMRIYFHHAEMGADLLAQLGLAREATIVRAHHKAPAENDPPELRILRRADEMN